jgi:hypothetical protein
VEDAQQVGNQENHQDGAQTDTSASTVTPAAMAIVPAAGTQHQQQDDKQYQHCESPFFPNLSSRPAGELCLLVRYQKRNAAHERHRGGNHNDFIRWMSTSRASPYKRRKRGSFVEKARGLNMRELGDFALAMANFARSFTARRFDQRHKALPPSGTSEVSSEEQVGAARALGTVLRAAQGQWLPYIQSQRQYRSRRETPVLGAVVAVDGTQMDAEDAVKEFQRAETGECLGGQGQC